VKNLSRDEAAERAALLRVESYEVRLDLTAAPSATRFDTGTRVVFECRRDGADTFIEHEVPAWGSAVLDGVPLDLGTVAGNRLPLRGLSAGRHELEVRALADYSVTGEGLHRAVDPADGEVYLYQQSFLDDAQRTFACFDQPDLKAPITLTVQAPAGWVVGGNTRPTPDGTGWVFAPTEPISTYLFTLAAGPYHVQRACHGGIEMGLWCRQSMRDYLDPDDLFTATRQSFDLQQKLFGRPYPFGDSYDQVFVPGFNAGAMENPGMVTFTDDFLFRSKVTLDRRRLRATVVAHEMAHMWFGDLVTMCWWDDLWLNESFAELLGTLTVDEATDLPGSWAAFTVSRKAWGYAADQLPTTHPVTTEVADTQSALLNFDGISYAKGASVLRQLIAYVGRDAFFAGVRDYLDRHAWGNTTLADLLVALERSSGRELRAWADGWLRTTGVSTLRPVWDGDALAVEQESPTPRIARIGVGRWDLIDGVLHRRDLTEVDVGAGRTPVPVSGPRPSLLLLNDGDLAFVKIRFDERSAQTLVRHLHTIDDDLSRALCWAALWDSTRDAELPAWAYVDAVLAGAAVEDDPEQVQTLLAQATTAATRYLPVGSRPEFRRRLADACWASAVAAKPGSDLQLVYVKAFLQVAEDDRIDGLLVSESAVDAGGPGSADMLPDGPGAEGELTAADRIPPGLVVDTDLRWLVLRRLAALGRADVDRLDAELREDATAAGERQHAAALAARPLAVAKEQAFAMLTEQAELSNDLARAVATGFWQYGQEDLLRPWVTRYFAALPGMWASRGPAVALQITRLLYPQLDESETLTRTDEFLAAADLPAGCRRTVLERRDDTARALRAIAAA
jgi:aminopeptidase N